MKQVNESRRGQAITRSTTCPCFAGRRSLLAIEPICWFCKYAGFDLKAHTLPEQGTCCYPEEQIRKEGTP